MRRLLLISLALTLLACGNGDGGPTLQVEESEQLGTTWDCADPGDCIDDYLAFPELAAEHARPISEEELNNLIDDCRYGRVDVHTEELKPETLREGLLGALNIRFLREGLDERLLETTIIRREEHGDYTEEEILFHDPWVGTFQGILLLPPGPGPHRGIVAVHGHSDSAAVFRDDYHGSAYPPEGFAILMLTMRAMGFDEKETEASWALLSSGFNLIGLRIYESLLGYKYLRWRKDIDEFRLGLIGHSGGSSTGNLTIRLQPRLRAYVSDHMVAYMTSDMDIIHCETVPAVYPYNRLINYFDTAEVPVKSVTYGYPNGPGELIEFFKQKTR
jgi:hypothetical protein